MLNAPPLLLCVPPTDALEIDGDLDKPAWIGAPGVVLVDVVSGGAARWATKLRLLWDRDHLYVAFECRAPDLRAKSERRDDPVYHEDAVEVFLDPYSRGRVYYEIDLSPRNVVFDALIQNRGAPDGERDLSTLAGWDCSGLRTATRVVASAEAAGGCLWRAELAIPFRSLAPSAPIAAGQRWSANFFRIQRAATGDEYQAWSPTGWLDFHRPSCFGVLELVDTSR